MNTTSIARKVADQAKASMSTEQIMDTIRTLEARNFDQDGDLSIMAALTIALDDLLGTDVMDAADEMQYAEDITLTAAIAKVQAA